jgi:hypothetical protein
MQQGQHQLNTPQGKKASTLTDLLTRPIETSESTRYMGDSPDLAMQVSQTR